MRNFKKNFCVVALLMTVGLVYAADKVTGVIKEVNVEKCTISVNVGEDTVSVTVAKDAKITLNGQAVKLDALKAGDKVTIVHTDKVAAEVKATR